MVGWLARAVFVTALSRAVAKLKADASVRGRVGVPDWHLPVELSHEGAGSLLARV